MAKDWKDRLGIVYSTNPDFKFKSNPEEDQNVLPPDKQILRVILDRKQRKGKTVTLVQGFESNQDQIANLSKLLKTKCGTGGSYKEGEIIIQGDFCEKVKELLRKEGYKVKN
jgi:translation initiation factor 1